MNIFVAITEMYFKSIIFLLFSFKLGNFATPKKSYLGVGPHPSTFCKIQSINILLWIITIAQLCNSGTFSFSLLSMQIFVSLICDKRSGMTNWPTTFTAQKRVELKADQKIFDQIVLRGVFYEFRYAIIGSIIVNKHCKHHWE